MSRYRDLIMAEPPLVGFWPLDEAAGTFADVKGGAHGTLSGSTVQRAQPSITNDASERSLMFTVGTSSIILPDLAYRPAGVAPVSLEAWFTDTLLSATRYVIAIGTDALNAISLRASSGNSFLIIRAIAGSPTTAFVPGTPLVVGERHHVVGTYDGSRLRLYWDGVLIATSGVTTAAFPSGPLIPRIGAFTDGGNRWGGQLQNVAYYNAELTAGQVAAHYAEGRALYATGALAAEGALAAGGSVEARGAASMFGGTALSANGDAIKPAPAVARVGDYAATNATVGDSSQ